MQSMNASDWANCGRQWANKHLQTNDSPIPVFQQAGPVVKVDTRIKPGVLCRTQVFNKTLADITDQVRAGFKSGIEGMLYCLYVIEHDQPIPLYVGIAKAIGHSGRLSSLFSNPRKKPRFDDYDGYHIGDLSTQVIPGYPKKKAYKKVWAACMFVKSPSMKPELRTPVYFWGKAWCATDISAVRHLGHTSLCLEEMILIEAMRAAYPGRLLNR
jgi:hypothetical protein